jgi:hypothetical protein
MARWYGGQLLVQESGQPLRVQQRLGLLVEERLVGRAAALGQHQELVLRGRAGRAVQLDLRRQVRSGVPLVPERGRRHLRVAQVQLVVGGEDAPGDGLLVLPAGEHRLGAFPDDDGGAGVLAHRQHPAGRHAGVAQQVDGHEAVVRRCLGIVHDGPQLGQVRGPQQVLDVLHGLVHQRGDGGRLDLQERPAQRLDDPTRIQVQTSVVGVVRSERQYVGVVELGHHPNLTGSSGVGPAPTGPTPHGRRSRHPGRAAIWRHCCGSAISAARPPVNAGDGPTRTGIGSGSCLDRSSEPPCGASKISN